MPQNIRKYALKYAGKLPANPHSYGILGYSAKYIQIHTNIYKYIPKYSPPPPLFRQIDKKKGHICPFLLSPPSLNK